ncbi:hypothetical protein BH11VER1_BH11VER1_26530 [soil metagenome]
MPMGIASCHDRDLQPPPSFDQVDKNRLEKTKTRSANEQALRMIKAVLDKTLATQAADGTYIALAGWSFAEEGHILLVQVWADGSLLGYLPYGYPRPDVQLQFKPLCVSEGVGFQGNLKLSDSLSRRPSIDLRVIFTTSEMEMKELSSSLKLKGTSCMTGNPLTEESPLISPQPVLSAESHKTPSKLSAPNFFILGAGKCGTTSLYHALKQHPEIHLSSVKEPSFFSPDFQVIKNPIEYFNLFATQEGKKRYGEASHVYFSCPETAPVVRQLFPQAKFLLILRDPVNRAYSLYQHMKRVDLESCATFEEGLQAEDHRFTDASFKIHCPQYFWNYMYYRSSLYDIQLQRYLELFSRDQFFVLTLGEWKSDPAYWQKKIFRFLEIEDGISVDAEPQNQAGGYAPLSHSTRSTLEGKFHGLRDRVEHLIGRHLAHWDF